jgi:hypothetical protein
VENADPPATLSHPDSLEAVTKGRNSYVKIGDQTRPKFQTSMFTIIDTTISKKIPKSLYEQKPRKPWFDDEWSKFSDHRKETKLHGLHDPNTSNVTNLNMNIVDISGIKRGNL